MNFINLGELQRITLVMFRRKIVRELFIYLITVIVREIMRLMYQII